MICLACGADGSWSGSADLCALCEELIHVRDTAPEVSMEAKGETTGRDQRGSPVWSDLVATLAREVLAAKGDEILVAHGVLSAVIWALVYSSSPPLEAIEKELGAWEQRESARGPHERETCARLAHYARLARDRMRRASEEGGAT